MFKKFIITTFLITNMNNAYAQDKAAPKEITLGFELWRLREDGDAKRAVQLGLKTREGEQSKLILPSKDNAAHLALVARAASGGLLCFEGALVAGQASTPVRGCVDAGSALVVSARLDGGPVEIRLSGR